MAWACEKTEKRSAWSRSCAGERRGEVGCDEEKENRRRKTNRIRKRKKKEKKKKKKQKKNGSGKSGISSQI